MANDIIKLLSSKNEIIAKVQANSPLVVIGNSPFKIYLKGDLKGKVLTDIYFYGENAKEPYIAHNVHLETLNIFTPQSILYKNNIQPLGTVEEFRMNPDLLKKSIRINELEDSLRGKLGSLLSLKEYDHVRIAEIDGKKIIIPSYVVGNFFYYPNSYIKRAFFAQDINVLINEGLTECNQGSVCFANTHIKFTKNNVILSYLYYCNRYAQTVFYNAFAFFIKNNIKNFSDKVLNDKKRKFLWANPNFIFPISKEFNGIYRGTYIDKNTFLVFEIVDIEFKELFGFDKLIGFYEGKEKVKQIGLKKFSSGKANSNKLSHTNPYSSKFEQTDIGTVQRENSQINQLVVQKGKAVCRGEILYSVPVKKSFEASEGVTIDSTRDPNSRYAKGYIYKINFDFKEAMELLKNRLGLEKSELIERNDYYGFLFWWNGRNYFILELKSFEAQTLLFSSQESLKYKYIVKTIFEIKEGSNKWNYKDFGKELYEKHNTCFHIPQKHVGDSLERWIERLVEKMGRVDECKK